MLSYPTIFTHWETSTTDDLNCQQSTCTSYKWLASSLKVSRWLQVTTSCNPMVHLHARFIPLLNHPLKPQPLILPQRSVPITQPLAIDWLAHDQSITGSCVHIIPPSRHSRPIATLLREFPLSLISLHFDAVTDRWARLPLRASRHHDISMSKTTQRPRHRTSRDIKRYILRNNTALRHSIAI